jgi:putative spermidine/putrescine transport system permease protein
MAMKEVGRTDPIAILLALPMFLFIAVTLFLPIALMIWESVRDGDVRSAMSRTVAALNSWNPGIPVPHEAFDAVVADLATMTEEDKAHVARRLNIERPGLRTMFLATAADPAQLSATVDGHHGLTAVDPRWDKSEIWNALWSARGPFTERFLLTALDLERGADGKVRWRSDDRAIYLGVYLRTFTVAATVTIICLVLGLPLALYLASTSRTLARRLLLILMLPLWTSVLVRAMAWILILQKNGVVNGILKGLGVIDQPFALVFNRFGVIVTMSHVLLPYMVLPMLNAMRNVPRLQLMAAGSLGASPWVVFSRVYLPQCRFGILAGSILVLASATGYYITPALVGGGGDQMLGTFVETAAIRTSNPELAASLGLTFLTLFLILLAGLALLLRPATGSRGAIRV